MARYLRTTPVKSPRAERKAAARGPGVSQDARPTLLLMDYVNSSGLLGQEWPRQDKHAHGWGCWGKQAVRYGCPRPGIANRMESPLAVATAYTKEEQTLHALRRSPADSPHIGRKEACEANLKLAQSMRAHVGIGKARHGDKNSIFIRKALRRAASYCTRDKNDSGKRRCAHVSLLCRRRVRTKVQDHVTISTQ